MFFIRYVFFLLGFFSAFSINIFQGFLKPFAFGTILNLALNLVKRKKDIWTTSTCMPGLAIGAFSAIFKFFTCLSRNCLEKDVTEASIPAGFASGLVSAMLYPSQSLSIYTFWKTMEVVVTSISKP